QQIIPAFDDDPLVECWDDLLRLAVTIKLKEATASSIFRHLNSYSHQYRLYQAMKAFGQIIKSMFILRHIDQAELRRAIEKQLNKIELANRFTRAVAVGNPNGLEYAEKSEQEIAEGCNRLIKNSIICWNYLYLTREVTRSKPKKSATDCWTSSKHTHRSRGAVSTCLESSIFPTRSYRIRSAFFPKKACQNHSRKLGAAKTMIRTSFQ
ncbi:MAG: Tn3 family transposase, partial [Roseovarius sp.]|nr:Tn3 family transposase [Roseovarius sp.]